MLNIEGVKAQRTVVISGVTRGLGRALSAEFVRNGWFVYGCGTNAGTVDQLQRYFGSAAQIQVVDVTNSRQVEAWAVQLPSTPQLVIANAGVIHVPASAWAIPEEEMRRNQEVNVMGVFHLAHAFIPRLLPHGGAFIGLSSSWGREAAAGMAAYCASKFAVEGFLQSLALDAPPRVRVYPLDPGGGIDTDMLRTSLTVQAGEYPTAEAWAETAYPFLVNELSHVPSGTPVTVPEVLA